MGLESGGFGRREALDERYAIHMHFRRHAEKAGGNDVPQEEDLVMLLTPNGEVQAINAGKSIELSNVDTISGGPRARTVQTALRAAGWNNPALGQPGEKKIEEMLAVEDADGVPFSEKTFVDHRLDMPFNKPSEDHQRLNDAYAAGTYLKELIAMDTEAIAKGDRSQSVYATQARNIASLIEQNARVAEAMRTVERERKDPKNREVEMLGTHGGIGESFLMELIARTQGEAERQKMAEVMGSGFKFVEGFDAEVVASKKDEPVVKINFAVERNGQKYSYGGTVPITVIHEMIKDLSPKAKDS